LALILEGENPASTSKGGAMGPYATLDRKLRELWASEGLEVVLDEVGPDELGFLRWTVTAREVEHRFGRSGICSRCEMELDFYEKAIAQLKGWPPDSEKDIRISELKQCRP